MDDCFNASRDRWPVGRFPTAYDAGKRGSIAQWAAGHYGPRASAYMQGVTRGYREAAAQCRTDEARERRRTGRTIYDVALDQERAIERQEAVEHERDDRRKLEDRVRELENRLHIKH